MSKKSKKNKKNLNQIKETKNLKNKKKILDSDDLIATTQEELERESKNEEKSPISLMDNKTVEIQKEETKLKEEDSKEADSSFKESFPEKEETKKGNFYEQLQSFISIFFTIIIFIAFLLLIFVLYNTYIKKNDTTKCDVKEVCKDYIKKDYGIKEEEVKKFIFNTRNILYNIEKYDKEKLTNRNLLEFSTYFIWGSDEEYLPCDKSIDTKCLITKKEISFDKLKEFFETYLAISDLKIEFRETFDNQEEMRLYPFEDKVVLSFKEFTYETLKHDIIDIRILEDEVTILFALSKPIEKKDVYQYVGFKKVVLKYTDSRFIIKAIETNLLSK